MIRVIRILEYQYDNEQDRDYDRRLWTHDGPRLRGTMKTLGIHESGLCDTLYIAVEKL